MEADDALFFVLLQASYMYGKALFGLVLVVLGAVLPYLLADEKVNNKINAWLNKSSSAESEQTAEPPTANNKAESLEAAEQLVTLPISQEPIHPSVASSRRSGYPHVPPHYGQPYDPRGASDIAIWPNGPGGVAPQSPPMQSIESAGPRLVGPAGVPIQHLLSFRVTPEWIRENWSRVTTGLSDPELQGWRVPVNLDDAHALVGSVTYYFDRQRRVQRILLHGYTTAPQELAKLATSRYSMRRIPHTEDGLYLYRVKGQTLGGLHIRQAPIIRRNGKTAILLELNREGSVYGPSYEFSKTLRQALATDRDLKPLPELSLEDLQTSLTSDQLERKSRTVQTTQSSDINTNAIRKSNSRPFQRFPN